MQLTVIQPWGDLHLTEVLHFLTQNQSSSDAPNTVDNLLSLDTKSNMDIVSFEEYDDEPLCTRVMGFDHL
jgi:hypothetical protein